MSNTSDMYPSPILVWTPKEQLTLTYPEVCMMQKILSIFFVKKQQIVHIVITLMVFYNV